VIETATLTVRWSGGQSVAGATETARLGGVVSTTEIVKLACAAFPDASVAVHVTCVVPSANVEPDA
jgi:hypothetical protein